LIDETKSEVKISWDCLFKNIDFFFLQGFGMTEDGTSGDLLQANVTIISNEECRKTLNTVAIK
jgi:hypothetical protein